MGESNTQSFEKKTLKAEQASLFPFFFHYEHIS